MGVFSPWLSPLMNVCSSSNRTLFPIIVSHRSYGWFSTADLLGYISMAYGTDSVQTSLRSHAPFRIYLLALEIALNSLNPVNPNRLDLTLNLALFYHEVLGLHQHACHFAKFGFDEAVKYIGEFPEYEVPDVSFQTMNTLKEHMTSWTSRS